MSRADDLSKRVKEIAQTKGVRYACAYQLAAILVALALSEAADGKEAHDKARDLIKITLGKLSEQSRYDAFAIAMMIEPDESLDEACDRYFERIGETK